jgi:hypothetical protein
MQQQKPDDGDVVMKEDGDGEDLVGDAAVAKCARCTKRGHFATACKVEIYCVICDKHNDHVNYKCPHLKGAEAGGACSWVCSAWTWVLSHPAAAVA